MTPGGIRQLGIELFDQWTAMWNLELELAEKIMAPEFTLRYAQAGAEAFDHVRSPRQLADIIAAWHGSRPGLRFTAEGAAAVDLTEVDGGISGLVARPYLATFTGEDGQPVAKSGTDILRISHSLITEVWSVSGGRTFYGSEVA